MQLFGSPMSPYVRKVRALVLETGLEDRVPLVQQDPRRNTGGYHRKYPLARVPALECDDGEVLFDSPVICEYLDSLHRRRKMFPARGKARWRALKFQAVGDGIMDCAVPLRAELLRPARQRSTEFIERRHGDIVRTVGALDQVAKAGELGRQSNIGTLAVACALGYLDFRFPDLPWRRRRKTIADWYAAFDERRSMRETLPEQI
ncbi:MAG: glutathione S-transferase N-terminal domain-containing protein [Alphaproteobacteria bacterium]|nr:glutathione S-transferase N-terminal domain-containing protein [Alphaproteobacteria bacterium]